MPRFNRQFKHFQPPQDVADIVLVGFDIFVQAEPRAAPFN